MHHRLLIVSNRLPVSVHRDETGLRLTPASGGLATGLRQYHKSSQGLWIGWPGNTAPMTDPQADDLERQLRARSIVPVRLSQDHVERYYNGFANRVLWPLFHYLVDRVPVDAAGWDAYRQVNETFADVVAREYRPDDVIWIHDYQLMLLPRMLRERLPTARIGFFLHIPFPSSEVFRVLPWRRHILAGVLGADLVGFHTFAYLRHFMAAVSHLDGVERGVSRLRFEGRTIDAGVFPMGVDARQFAALAETEAVTARAAAIRDDAGSRRIVLGVDRLDYTKGIPRRLQAIERLLERHPDLEDRIRYIQVAVPSRGGVDSYQRFRREVEERVGRINGAHGTSTSTPVHYIHRAVTQTELVALFRAADIMLVTPLRDGMNLVAKEFAAARVDGEGVLVLSEFTGAAAELEGALLVNPYDVDAIAARLHEALSMPADERRSRMRRLRRRVLEHDVHAWTRSFLERLAREPAPTQNRVSAATGPEAALSEARTADRLHLLLDYDGTLVPLASAPRLAAPDADLLALLAELAATTQLHVSIVSGRSRETLETWLGHLPLTLWAEHGFWRRMGSDRTWRAASALTAASLLPFKAILDQFVEHTPGSLVEVKTRSMAWHYRRADREFGARQAQELRMLLEVAVRDQPFEVIEGSKVIEVRPRGINKGLAARTLPADLAGASVIAFGDDRTDEDLFDTLPPSAVTIAVGTRPSSAKFRVADYREVRRLLRSLIRDRAATDSASAAMWPDQAPA